MPPLPASLSDDGDVAGSSEAAEPVDAEVDAPAPDEAPTVQVPKTSVDEEMPPLPASLAEPGESTEAGASTDAAEAPTVPVSKTSVDEEAPTLPANLVEGEAGSSSEPETIEEGEDAASRQLAFSLRFAGEGESEPVPLSEGQRIVGRSRSADITVESRSVSRRHAVLTVTSDVVTLRDLESRNHTYLEGERVTVEVELSPGANIRFGDLEAVLVGEESPG
jgi:hypothetical protein